MFPQQLLLPFTLSSRAAGALVLAGEQGSRTHGLDPKQSLAKLSSDFYR